MKLRKYSHSRDCNNPNSSNYNSKLYKTIREEHGGWNEFKLIEIGTAEQMALTQAADGRRRQDAPPLKVK
jgi:hypothetical protein